MLTVVTMLCFTSPGLTYLQLEVCAFEPPSLILPGWGSPTPPLFLPEYTSLSRRPHPSDLPSQAPSLSETNSIKS